MNINDSSVYMSLWGISPNFFQNLSSTKWVSRSGEPFSRGEILKEVWGYTPERHVDTRVVDVHISRLRSKLEADPANPELILTARGTGYLFQRIVDIAPFDSK